MKKCDDACGVMVGENDDLTDDRLLLHKERGNI